MNDHSFNDLACRTAAAAAGRAPRRKRCVITGRSDPECEVQSTNDAETTQAKRATTPAARATRRRTAAKEVRQQQLIKATLSAVAKKGFAETTLADVAREARLSQGIINLHFRSKDKLLEETLRHLAAEYKQAWERTLERAGASAADRLAALVQLDFERAMCERNKLAVWFAFWGEAKSRPTYRKLCAERDREYDEVMLALCRELVEEGGYEHVDPGGRDRRTLRHELGPVARHAHEPGQHDARSGAAHLLHLSRRAYSRNTSHHRNTETMHTATGCRSRALAGASRAASPTRS